MLHDQDWGKWKENLIFRPLLIGKGKGKETFFSGFGYDDYLEIKLYGFAFPQYWALSVRQAILFLRQAIFFTSTVIRNSSVCDVSVTSPPRRSLARSDASEFRLYDG